MLLFKQDYQTIPGVNVPYGVACMAYATAGQPRQRAEDIIVVLLRRVAREAGGGGVLADLSEASGRGAGICDRIFERAETQRH